MLGDKLVAMVTGKRMSLLFFFKNDPIREFFGPNF